ncbi:hypothetical protein [Pseudobutyrivibrio sp. MD2005]|uniref:hypothetical protein n=1 Tax=Pseudobutyrivibrio sp. MD2005 TaxID=1410616 RepID=UPI0004865D86|nr:hypothetical protein [Pseudobutyrivibrio sp. MD2005]
MRKHDVNEINLQVDEVEFIGDGLLISWSSSIGFGQYDISYSSEFGWTISSECMDSNEDKAFGKKLLELIIDKAKVID